VNPHTLHRLLDRNLQLAPEFGGQLTNHLPMALHALYELGAEGLRLEEFFERYVARREGVAVWGAAAPVADWRPLRGQPEAFAVLQATFDAAIAGEGEVALLRRVLPDLLPGVAAAAFHGVIRTAHAVQAGHRGELAAALAYWAWRWQPVTCASAPAVRLDFDTWAARLVEAGLHSRPEGPLIALRMQAAERSPVFGDLASALHTGPRTLQRLTTLAAERYAASGNFTLLHLVTGLRAWSVVRPRAGAMAGIDELLVRAFTSAYLAARTGASPAGDAPAPRPWPEVLAAARRSDDDHVIKLVHACRDHEAAFGGEVWRAAATRAVA